MQLRDLDTGADAEAMEGCCLLACSSWFAQPAFLTTELSLQQTPPPSLLSYRTQDHQPRDGTTHTGLGPPLSVNS